MPIIGNVVKVAAVTGCAWCLENFEKEPVWCAFFCGAGTIIGAKITYDSAKKALKVCKPFISGTRNWLIKNN